MYSLGCKLIRVGRILNFWLLNDTHFVWLDTLTILANNLINIFLKNLNIILYYFQSLNIGESWECLLLSAHLL